MSRWSSVLPALAVLALAASGSAQPSATPRTPTPRPDDPPPSVRAPLPDAHRALTAAIPDEHTVPLRFHYPVSNEWRHDLFFPDIENIGGAFLGVGSDQCYTLAAVQNAEIVWLVDYDPMIPRIHRIYRILLESAETPQQLVSLFSPRYAREAVRMIEASGDPDTRQLLRLYNVFRERMFVYLGRVARHGWRDRATTWLSDGELFRRARALHLGGRMIPVTADVRGPDAMQRIAAASSELGVPLRVLYLSNAEQFFPYGQGFRTNMAAFPTDEATVVLRTFRERGAPYPTGDRWHYLVQPWSDFVGRMDEGYRHSRQFVFDVMRTPGALGRNGVSRIDDGVPRRY